MEKTLPANAKKAIGKYGLSVCLEAHRLNRIEGEGASTILFTSSAGRSIGSVRGVNAAIDAANEYLTLTQLIGA
jgi:hypothetical protein